MRDDNSNLPPPDLLKALRPRRYQLRADTAMTPRERAERILELRAELGPRIQGNGAPPPHLLGALRRPRRPQLHDPRAQELIKRWKRLGRPITMDDFDGLVRLLVPDRNLLIRDLICIRAAVVTAGITIRAEERRRARSAALTLSE